MTLETLNAGQVRTLYLLVSFTSPGGKCRRCDSLVLTHRAGDSSIPRPLCKGELKIVDLGEEMIRSALCQDGEVKWVEKNDVMKEYEGVCAFLRYRSSR